MRTPSLGPVPRAYHSGRRSKEYTLPRIITQCINARPLRIHATGSATSLPWSRPSFMIAITCFERRVRVDVSVPLYETRIGLTTSIRFEHIRSPSPPLRQMMRHPRNHNPRLTSHDQDYHKSSRSNKELLSPIISPIIPVQTAKPLRSRHH